ncbi:Retrovirus-related Pol polyprotein from transposon 17.6 [Trametes pubescens]|uniref:RNA-directed DNA polymerase n=1 Tax=Trametes pubescens TaxID=154538 RepID=A0A1M2V3G4_TRAPU|nr:Retrovirus-related Pol polyprotein from transposon 17.6 [Trametes pubescens]
MPYKKSKTTHKSKRTSTEAAAAAPVHMNVPETSEVLEAIGELPTPYSLPPAEPLPARRTPKNPIVAAASEIALSAKWGMADYERLVEPGGSRRVTRTYAHAVRDKSSDSVLLKGEQSASAVGVASDDGLTMRIIQTMTVHTPPGLGKEERLPGSPLEVEPHPEKGCAPSPELHHDGSTPEHDETNCEGGSLGLWVHTTKGGTRATTPCAGSLVVASTSRFPSWFDLCELEDQLGPVPDGWDASISLPTLPSVKQMDPSFSDEFWREVESSASEDDDYDLQLAIRASLTTAAAEGELQDRVLQAMAVIVEVKSDERVPKPAGHDGRYTSEQKAKEVPRDRSQREFLRQFVSQTPEPSDKPHPKVSATSSTPRATPHAPRNRASATPRPAKHSEFQRDASQVPEGGWFHRTTEPSGGGGGGPPTDHSSSPPTSDDSSPDSDSESSSTTSSSSSPHSDSSHAEKSVHAKRHRKRQKDDHKRMRRALAGIKIKPLFVWDGSADLDTFDQWTYEVDTWGELNELSDHIILKLMVQFMTGEPGRFFMRHVSTRQSEWTVKRLYEALFDYCFPTDYKSRLRSRLERSTQGKSRVRDFVRDIQQLAVRFPDVTDFQLVQIFWRGLNTYIRVYLIEKGLNPEKTKLDKLVKYAIRKEEAYSEARREERSFSGQIPGRSWGRFGTRTDGPEPFKPTAERREGDSGRDRPKSTKPVPSGGKAMRQEPHKTPQRAKEHTNILSREERDRLRAEGRCFNCRDVGHQSSNCPARKTAKAPSGAGIHVGSVNFAALEELADRAQRSKDDALFMGAVILEQHQTPMPDSQPEGIWTRAHEADCIEYIQSLFQSYHDPELARSVGWDPLMRFEVDAYGGGDEFLVVDRLGAIGLPDEYIVTRQQLDDPSWGVPEIIQHEWDAWIHIPPRPDWGTGFPPCDTTPDDISPLYWLRAHVRATLQSDFPDIPLQNELVDVHLHPSGYVATSVLSTEEHVFTHEEVKDPSFDPTAISRVLLDGYTTDDLWAHHRAIERRRQRRQRLMAGAVGLRSSKSSSKKKPGHIPANAIPAIERNAMRPKDFTRTAPLPVVVTVQINGRPARALLDTGCMADFISTTLVDQLKLPTEVLEKQLPVQLAVQGSRSKISRCATVDFAYQDISSRRRFDVVNLENYDIILGTPFMFQHKVALALNPARVVIGCSEPAVMEGEDVAVILSAAAELLEDKLDELREILRTEASDLCQDGTALALPPLRAINHTIPLIDESKIYSYRPSKCPEALKHLWQERKVANLDSGRWQLASGVNASPMLMIPKPAREDGVLRLRTVVDKREQNANTHKMAAPLPDMDGILRNVVKHKYRSLIDGKDAYEQIRVVPEHVPRTLFTTPDGTMISLVLQQGDVNGPTTYQMVMNHIFAPYIGVFMDVYLDDIVIYSDTIEDHMKHVRIVLDVLRREKFFLGADKMNFFATTLKILGHVVDDHGIRMDPHKVDSVLNWKVPTNKSLLSSFLGAVSFLAPDCEGIRIPMGVLAPLTSATKAWRWTDTHQRAFEQVQATVHKWRHNRRISLDYSEGAPTINLVTDASLTGASGYLCQGNDLTTAKVATFWSGKFIPAQQNYPVHEQELLAIVESLKRFRPLLYGATFRICTDHKALEYLMSQKHLSPRQHRWMDVLNEFKFSIHYIPGETNVLADALSRIYSDEPTGIERAHSEYLSDDGAGIPHMRAVYTGAAALLDLPLRRSARIAAKPRPEGAYNESTLSKTTPMNAPSSARVQRKTSTTQSLSTSPRARRVRLDDSATPLKVVDSLERSDMMPQPQGLVSTASEPGVQLPGALRGRYVEDAFFRKIMDAPSQFPHFALVDGLLYKKDDGAYRLCIPDVLFGTRNLKEIVIRQAHSLLAHLGSKKTMAYLRDEVWWPSMISDVAEYCRSCGVCSTTKSSTTRPMGLLRPLPVPRRPWQYIALDFVGPLPSSETRNGSYDMICVIIDQLTSMVHLVPTQQTYGAAEMAEVVFDAVYKLHGLPERIISDRDTLFTSIFWRRLHELLGTELRLSSAYHPQTDGMTERANRTMTQMLRQCVQADQKDWAMRLPAVELALNMARSDTTGFSPFYLNYGQMPRSLVWSNESEYPGVQAFAQRMKDAIMAAHDAIITARVDQVTQANRRRCPASFQVNDLVYLSTKNLSLPKGRARKLVPKYLGPFRILSVITEGATYRLELPKELRARGIHDAFHASLLRPHFPNDDRRFPGRQFHQLPHFGEQPREWAVDRILSHSGRGSDAEFEVQWTTGDVTWASYRDVQHLQALTEYFEALGVTSANQLRTHPAPALAAEPPLSMISVAGAYLGRDPPDGRCRSGSNSITASPTHKLRAVGCGRYLTSPTPFAPITPPSMTAYGAEHHVRWERYADAFRAWLAKRGPYPGNPPEGYVEVYKITQRYAPCPSEYADLVASEQQAPMDVPGVTMTSAAFTAFLAHASAVNSQIAGLLQQASAPRSHAVRLEGQAEQAEPSQHPPTAGGYDRGRRGAPRRQRSPAPVPMNVDELRDDSGFNNTP